MIRTVTYAAEEPGLRLVVLGAIHGNEKCGTVAIERIMAELNAGKLNIMRGQVTFIPICNPRAYEADKRFIERNLNRYLVPMEKPDSYEARLGNILCPIFAACDAMLDIHSYTIGGEPFISYEGDTPQERAFGASLGVRTLLTGWQEAYAKTGRNQPTDPASKEESTGGPQYARRHGAFAATIECGQHRDPHAPDVAYRGILGALHHLKMIDGPNPAVVPADAVQNVRMTHVYYYDHAGKFPQPWANFARVRKGEALAVYNNGEKILAPDDGFIIMPKANCDIGEEWFYFGVGV